MGTINLQQIQANYNDAAAHVKKRIIICAGTGCIANGSLKVYKAFEQAIKDKGLHVFVDLELNRHDDNDTYQLTGSGCQGFCGQGPLVNILPDEIMYTKVKEENVQQILEETVLNDRMIEELLYTNPADGKKSRGQTEIPFYKRQTRLVLGECSHLDPGNIREYIAHGGYFAAEKAFKEMTPEEVCNTILDSGLRGRGGGGFPTGRKWLFTLQEESSKKYVICNGDEGDPGAFMDRSLMEGNPHRVLEGMMIAARGIGADEAHVYVRLEYPLAIQRMSKAISDAVEIGILGEDIFGSGHNMHIHIMEGAGAFVCGEETALIASIEGKRGMPNPKPPFPAQKGLFGKPTVINNVETLAAVPLIIRNGASWFNAYGTEKSKGTKTFALTGHVANTGLIEVPFGTTLREIVYNIGGGVTNDDGSVTHEGFKAIQIGGPSGGCLTEDHLDIEIDYDNLIRNGAMVGSGGMVVMNKQSCMVQIARFFMNFTQNESCGKCVPCREGTKQMLALLDEIIDGTATEESFELLQEVAHVVKKASLCGLGKTAPSPVISTINRFREEYLEHIVKKRCKTNNCKALADITIDAGKCTGCTSCARKCPAGAISGEKKQVHVIDASLCTRCGVCASTCKFEAVVGF
ncbi:NADH-quinone oxidoreductase subunit F [Parabacteroides sp. PF5-5]|uniref:NADH-ubiquinone oxidoreductase-F iron-sulfur binding region domain-containing protein n=1 Tax=unclassified Parabacteroides TaxID=2649774 RepID=UPI002475816B|nr:MULTISPECIES: NADH-ubiquinone oxidoreductase-F iron-sulfur binding region domain-containing protein [unclassified Parabacteroides]MDH6304886.1 NADH-quinone oxidoreductase subunit F [Parabacteroides sp. PH5-39]MDH6316028.1 NADH-quinone oxidoreductase subunit F [Parabacteroides sp. PF5-13]MDH6319685.1 NADH-quinone oxidoreductase subunit F [Parabacteroides sp. PH5-13]MDH6323416.1 NADH-quinone oxidoreductase subunit F [Parabacteroides sp. PH5-8]MDH6327075.1 NADH-quinone oxidoreductase subunit F